VRHVALIALTPALVAGTLQVGTPASAKPAKSADLKVSSTKIVAAEAFAPGDSIAVKTTVANVGKAKAKATKVTYYLSSDKAVGKDVRLAAHARVGALAPGKKVTVSSKVVVPTSTADATYYLLACADAKGKDKKANNCRATSARATVRAPWKGTLTGVLSYDKGFENPGTSESSKDHATVNVKIEVDESKSGWAVFGNAGSTYDYRGSYSKHSGSDWCTTDVKGTSTGGGPLSQVGNQYEDDIMGSFGMLDHSEFDLLVGLRYLNTRTTTDTPVGNGCPAKTTVVGPTTSRNLTEIEFHRSEQSGKTVTYKIDEVLDPNGTKTSWTTVTGTLTLQLR
jgi:hypothetical protein